MTWQLLASKLTEEKRMQTQYDVFEIDANGKAHLMDSGLSLQDAKAKVARLTQAYTSLGLRYIYKREPKNGAILTKA